MRCFKNVSSLDIRKKLAVVAIRYLGLYLVFFVHYTILMACRYEKLVKKIKNFHFTH